MKEVAPILFLILGVSASPGAFECPCLNSSSSAYAAISAAAVAQGLSSTYGLNGCAQYDVGNALFNCDGANPPDFCSNPWCYIDTDVCPKSDDLCIAAGGVPGSNDSPYCRSRDFSSSDMTSEAWYSYATCGSINVYNVSGLTAGVTGHMLQIAVIPAEPWVTETISAVTGLKKYGGPSYEFFIESIGSIKLNTPAVNIADIFATPESRAKYPASSYTACVHDVAVGNWDICVADLWLTPERNQLAHFLPALRQDFFYLVVPREIEEVTFMTRLLTPFKPFAVDGWLGICAFLCGMASLLWLLHFIENGWQGCDYTVAGWLRFQFAIWHDFLLGGGNIEVEKGPVYKLLHLSFAFFILVTLASYTASLASLLVVQAEAKGTVGNIEEAIAQGYRICAPAALVDTFKTVFGDVFVPHDDYMAGPRNFYAGNCEAMVLSQDLMDRVHAGLIKEKDCAEVANGLSAEEGRCDSDHQGLARNDCNFIRAGDPVWNIPLSFPIAERLSHPVSWAFIRAKTSGVMEERIEANAGLFPSSICDVETRTEEEGLTLGDLSGMIFISLFVAVVAVLCYAGTVAYHKIRGDAPATPETPETADTVDVEKPKFEAMPHIPHKGESSEKVTKDTSAPENLAVHAVNPDEEEKEHGTLETSRV